MSAARCVVGEWSYEWCKVCRRGSGSKSVARCVVGGVVLSVARCVVGGVVLSVAR